ncbi:hypothetical protein JMJ35_009746 [Cladonia borealis]|uniref:Uncharacterized protein n=1 Tax=Cladonia borealis TaxID=184061 RepID=A0AA39QRI1_9LECA|nr:hypothetical protein JMJ35_009746 [Cladonia borealis]
MHVLQDLVNNNKTARLRKWAQAYIKFGTQLIGAGSPDGNWGLVGTSIILATAQHKWREGVDISARGFAQFASIAYHRDVGESLHYGGREFLIDFDGCIWNGRRAENVARTVVLFSTHFAILETKDPRPIEYFSTVIAEYFEGFIGGSYEEQLFSGVNQACANEFGAISEGHDPPRLLLFLTAILQFAQRSGGKGQDRFLNMPPASCLLFCQNGPIAHRWLIGEAVPETMSALISRLKSGPKCWIIRMQYSLLLPVALQQTVKWHLDPFDGVDGMLDQILSP